MDPQIKAKKEICNRGNAGTVVRSDVFQSLQLQHGTEVLFFYEAIFNNKQYKK